MVEWSRKPVIGLLGAPGAGKSLVARQFGELGCAVIDADALAREALGAEGVREQLVSWWGPGVLNEAGEVDRQAVSRVVFNDAEELRRLESVVHPEVGRRRAALHERYQGEAGVKAIVEDSPLLLEKGLAEGCEVLVYVEASREVRLRRLAASRGWTEQELAGREKNQWSLDRKRARADYIVTNHADEAETLQQVRRVLSRILHC